MTLEQIKTAVASYVNASKAAAEFGSPTRDNLAGLLDKIAKTVTIDGIFSDKLEFMNGQELEFGRTVEEYYQDLDTVQTYSDYSNSGTPGEDALRPYYPTYRPASYNFTLGRRIIPTTLKYNEYERACNSPEELAGITSMVLKRLYDTFGVFKFDAKKKILGNLADKCIDMKTSTSALDFETNAPHQYHSSSESTAVTQAIVAGDRYYIGASLAAATKVGIAIKARTSASKTWAEDVAAGNIVELQLVKTLAKPDDTEKGESFVEEIKKAVEEAQFVNEGNSLNGNTIGAENGLALVIVKGLKPILDVQVEAGCFNPEKLAVPAEIFVVDEIPGNSKCYAMLMDKRAARLHPSYMAVREQVNAIGDYVNYFLHTENTAWISRNCFVRCYLDE